MAARRARLGIARRAAEPKKPPATIGSLRGAPPRRARPEVLHPPRPASCEPSETDAAEVETQRPVACVRESASRPENDLVVNRPAEEGVRVGEDGASRAAARPGFPEAFEAPGRPGEDDGFDPGRHGYAAAADWRMPGLIVFFAPRRTTT
jgi:hypothetical protein